MTVYPKKSGARERKPIRSSDSASTIIPMVGGGKGIFLKKKKTPTGAFRKGGGKARDCPQRERGLVGGEPIAGYPPWGHMDFPPGKFSKKEVSETSAFKKKGERVAARPKKKINFRRKRGKQVAGKARLQKRLPLKSSIPGSTHR